MRLDLVHEDVTVLFGGAGELSVVVRHTSDMWIR